MDRRSFMQAMVAAAATTIPGFRNPMTLDHLSAITETYSRTERMSVFFIGHGNPMNALWDNTFTQSLHREGGKIEPRPPMLF